MKKILILYFLLYFLHVTSTIAMQCNGTTENCNKPYNKVTEIMTHNSTSTKKDKLLGIIPNPVGDQNRDLGQQLNEGIRAFKLPIHIKDGQAWIAHALPQNEFENYTKKYVPFFLRKEISGKLWMIDPSNISLVYFLQQIKRFLDQHPHEIITLLLNIFDDSEKLIPDAFASAGISEYMYEQDINKPWPTYQELIKSGKRLIVFVDSHIPRELASKYPWITQFMHVRNFFIENGYDYKSIDSLKNDSCNLRRGNNLLSRQADNAIFLINHFVTSGIAGSAQDAASANRYDMVKEHLDKCMKMHNKKPKFLHLDFYDENGPQTKKAIEEINNQ